MTDSNLRTETGQPARHDAARAPTKDGACDLLEGLVRIRSLSGEEGEASAWLVERMKELGFDRAYVDDAGNAVGELGDPDGKVVMLLGHIDTVEGEIRVRREVDSEGREWLYGRGAVDAKGPLVAFVCGAARFGSAAARERGLRVVVVGAVEEEAATSKGARHIAKRFDGVNEPVPAYCVIGEPSRWDRVCVGYKGRFLCELEAEREMAHTAGPDPGVTVAAVAVWRELERLAEEYNAAAGREKAFDQVLPSLRGIWTESDGLSERVRALMGVRLPIGFEIEAAAERLGQTMAAWAQGELRRVGSCASGGERLAERNADATAEKEDAAEETPIELHAAGDRGTATLRFSGIEEAWRSERTGVLPGSFLAAIREVGGEQVKPGFVVKTGTSDMNVVGPRWRCPIVAYGPGDSGLDHTPREAVELGELRWASAVVEAVLRRL